eukprot:CAMPEP_0178372542 /NCGR_PEP_ID=MMETSP0689_2-20121128/1406_1 /TAXON_ID=160604 /ORGANISM="Amphidinium massartii, Strain CS-259" /LENGTH=843 /DNA_ID=CAMNT_0019992467 /DNA_START=43 /DNA_END=2571 /DNA_ORIENTATION=+
MVLEAEVEDHACRMASSYIADAQHQFELGTEAAFNACATLADEAREAFEAAGDFAATAHAFRVATKAELGKIQLLKQKSGYRYTTWLTHVKRLLMQAAARLREQEEHGNPVAEGWLNLLMAEICMARDQSVEDATEDYVQEGLELFEQSGNREGIATAQLLRAQIAFERHDIATAQDAANSAMSGGGEANIAIQADARHYQGLCHKATDTMASLNAADDCLAQAAELLRTVNSPAKQARERIALAEIKALTDQETEAVSALGDVKPLIPAHQVTGWGVRCSLDRVLVQTLLQARKIDAAIEAASTAVRSAQDRGDPLEEANALEQQILAVLRSAHAADAVDLSKTLIDLVAPSEDPQRMVQALLVQANVYTERACADDAIGCAEEAIKILRKLDGSPPQLAPALLELGRARLLSSDTSVVGLALANVAEAVDLYTKAGNPIGRGKSLMQMVQCHSRQGDVQAAVAVCQEASDVLEKAGCCRLQAQAMSLLADLHSECGDDDKAVEVLQAQQRTLKAAGFKKLEVLAWQQLAERYAAMGDTELYLDVAEEGCKTADNIKDPLIQLQMRLHKLDAGLMRLSNDSTAAGNKPFRDSMLTTAEATVRSCSQLPQKLRLKMAGRANFTWAKLYCAFNMTQAATSPARDANDSFIRANERVDAALSAVLLSEIYRKTGSLAMALQQAKSAVMGLYHAGPAHKKSLSQAKQLLRRFGELIPDPPPPPRPQEEPPVPDGQNEAASGSESEDPHPRIPKAEYTIPLVKRKVHESLMDVLVNDAAEAAVTNDVPFNDIGLDSLSLISFNNQLKVEFEVDVPRSYLTDYPTINMLSVAVYEQIQNSLDQIYDSD